MFKDQVQCLRHHSAMPSTSFCNAFDIILARRRFHQRRHHSVPARVVYITLIGDCVL